MDTNLKEQYKEEVLKLAIDCISASRSDDDISAEKLTVLRPVLEAANNIVKLDNEIMINDQKIKSEAEIADKRLEADLTRSKIELFGNIVAALNDGAVKLVSKLIYWKLDAKHIKYADAGNIITSSDAKFGEKIDR